MTLDILRKTGGWCVELQQPLKHRVGGVVTEITAVEIRPLTADLIIKWTDAEIVSMLALLSRMCGISEMGLRQLPQQDFDRVMSGFFVAVGPTIKAECESGKRPLATPEAELPPEAALPMPDQQDPRFPLAEGPVVRLKPPPTPQSPAEDAALDIAPPNVTEAVR